MLVIFGKEQNLIIVDKHEYDWSFKLSFVFWHPMLKQFDAPFDGQGVCQ